MARSAVIGACLAVGTGLPLAALAFGAQAGTAALAGGLCATAGLGAVAAIVAGRLRAAAAAADCGRSQALLASVQRVAQLGIAERVLKTGTSQWSDEFHAILGLQPGEVSPSAELFLECVHPSDREGVQNDLRRVESSGERAERNFRIIRPNGEIRLIHGIAERVTDPADGSYRMDAIIQDVTERKRLERELDALIRELWRSNEELEQFAYVASHDLRQPLRVVGSYVSLMEEELHGNLSGDTLEYMSFVRDGVRRMDRLINDLLTYSRVGRISTDQTVVLAEALDAALDDLQFEIEEAHAQIQVRGELPVVMGDQSELERLLLNLIGNAVKYRSPDRHPVITVSCQDQGDYWSISVEDNGIGIPAEHAERVFGIFQRLHARNEFEGTGVGLAIAKKIVDRHGGGIRVETGREEGACLTLTWPKVRVAASETSA